MPGGRPMGHKLSEETRQKMRKPHRPLTDIEKEANRQRQFIYQEAKRQWLSKMPKFTFEGITT
jgi:hypothetical protein